jgi:hypothetical protein
LGFGVNVVVRTVADEADLAPLLEPAAVAVDAVFFAAALSAAFFAADVAGALLFAGAAFLVAGPDLFAAWGVFLAAAGFFAVADAAFLAGDDAFLAVTGGFVVVAAFFTTGTAFFFERVERFVADAATFAEVDLFPVFAETPEVGRVARTCLAWMPLLAGAIIPSFRPHGAGPVPDDLPQGAGDDTGPRGHGQYHDHPAVRGFRRAESDGVGRP